MKTLIFSLIVGCALSACQYSNPVSQPPTPPEPPPVVVSKPKPPENVSVYLISPSKSNLTWKYSGQVDKFLISRGNPNVGWTEVNTVWASTREYHDPLPSNLVGIDGIYYTVTAVSSGVKSDTAMSNNLGMFKAYNAK